MRERKKLELRAALVPNLTIFRIFFFPEIVIPKDYAQLIGPKEASEPKQLTPPRLSQDQVTHTDRQ